MSELKDEIEKVVADSPGMRRLKDEDKTILSREIANAVICYLPQIAEQAGYVKKDLGYILKSEGWKYCGNCAAKIPKGSEGVSPFSRPDPFKEETP